ncbi:16346_t:CDS:2, partial [Racocetra fulgida]
DLRRLKEKVDAGADFIITQVFYDVDLFLTWTIVPKSVIDALEPIKHDDAAVKEYGIKLAVEMIRKMYDNGISGFHFYTMNLERSTRLILEALQFVAPVEKVKPLPWCPSLSAKRKKENVRPIFWRNRIKSYVTRTEAWDEFPNGRWGDARSPENALELWGSPNSMNDIYNIFVRYCRGELVSLPWSDQSLAQETDIIKDQLAYINSLGYLSINSQPAVNGVRSDHNVFGWGPKNGYVYQKSEGPNAVTWGVFPGKEIIQPTIVEADEAFELWNEWAKIYDPDSVSAKLITQIADNWYLINIVHNDFHDGSGIFRIFEPDGVPELVEAD